METIVVGIGASAGGQDAFARFFRHTPATSGLAFVLIQHLDPNHKSLLAQTIETSTSMPVRQAEEDMALQPDHVYTIPPSSDLAIRDGKFHLFDRPAPRSLHLPIDAFFRSLAEEQNEKGIAIILSGTGSDGTLGLGAIKEHGGLAIVQDPATAQFDGMPRSAIATGLADLILSPEQMAERILTYALQAYAPDQAQIQPAASGTRTWLARILGVLAAQTGHDFSEYKPKTLERRIERRMAVTQIPSAERYHRYLQENPQEAQTLFGDLLISVTQFFRDSEAFAALEQHAVPRLLDLWVQRQSQGPVRVWVPGCATGEEAYSIAILIQEFMEASGVAAPVTIFASDLDSRAIERARSGTYPRSIASDVGPERLARFFVETDGKYRVAENIRNLVVFAVHDMIKDPPFSKLDLISCRNLLIYLAAVSQKRAMSIFHYALRPGGLLFLGSSELPDASRRLFAPVDRKHKLFRRSDESQDRAGPVGPRGVRSSWRAAPPRAKESGQVNLREIVEKTLLENAPACLVINRSADILYIHGRTGKYLEPPQGEVGPPNALRMAREGLRSPLGAAVARAIGEQQAVIYDRVSVKTNGDEACLKLTVRPLPETAGDDQLLAVTIEELGPAACVTVPAATGSDSAAAHDALVAELERDLRATREYLQATVEELESANEELRSANEEMQSTNEELLTSREELQSVNEELVTLNSEHESKIEELTVTNTDLVNLLTRLDIGVIFLDRKLQIRRFNTAATRISNLLETDLGRPLSDLASHLAYNHLTSDARAVLETKASKKVELRASDGRWYLLRLQVYQTPSNVADGVMLTFSDITEQKAVQDRLRVFRRVMEQSVDAVLIANAEGVIEYANPRASSTAGDIQGGIEGRNLRNWRTGGDAEEIDRRLWQAVAAGQSWQAEYRVAESDGEEKWEFTQLQPIRGADDLTTHLVLMSEDITPRKQSAAHREAVLQTVDAAREFAERVVETVREPLLILDQDLRVVSANRAYYRTFDVPLDSAEGRFIYDLNHGALAGPRLREALEAVIAHDATFEDIVVDEAGSNGADAGLIVNARRIVAATGTGAVDPARNGDPVTSAVREPIVLLSSVVGTFRTQSHQMNAWFALRPVLKWACIGVPLRLTARGAQSNDVLAVDCGQRTDTLPGLTFEQSGATDMNLQQFERQVEALRKKVVSTWPRSGEQSALLPPSIAEAFSSLAQALEELDAADTEIRQQSDELVARQDALEAARRHWHALFDLAPDGYLVTDSRGIVLEANQASARLFCVSREELVGNPIGRARDARSTARFAGNPVAPPGVRRTEEARNADSYASR